MSIHRVQHRNINRLHCGYWKMASAQKPRTITDNCIILLYTISLLCTGSAQKRPDSSNLRCRVCSIHGCLTIGIAMVNKEFFKKKFWIRTKIESIVY